jgi:hypothetical protein
MARHSSHILELARKGAEHRYEELKAEMAALVRHFPHLRDASTRREEVDLSAEPAATIDRPRRKRRRMSAAARKAVSQRMRAYWAAKRSAKR